MLQHSISYSRPSPQPNIIILEKIIYIPEVPYAGLYIDNYRLINTPEKVYNSKEQKYEYKHYAGDNYVRGGTEEKLEEYANNTKKTMLADGWSIKCGI